MAVTQVRTTVAARAGFPGPTRPNRFEKSQGLVNSEEKIKAKLQRSMTIARIANNDPAMTEYKAAGGIFQLHSILRARAHAWRPRLPRDVNVKTVLLLQKEQSVGPPLASNGR